VVLQLYGLLLTLPSLGARGVLTIGLSVAVGVVGSATTLGSLAPKSGNGLFSRAFAMHWCYYVCELSMRLVSMSLLFVSLGPVAFAVLGVDFLARLWLAWFAGQERWSVNVVMQALLWFGSDAANGPDEASFVLSMGSGVILLLSLFLANLLDTPALALLRADPGGPVQGLTALACVAWLFKLIIGIYIVNTDFNASLDSPEVHEKKPPEGSSLSSSHVESEDPEVEEKKPPEGSSLAANNNIPSHVELEACGFVDSPGIGQV